MHLPAWKPDLIILNSRGSGNYKQRVGGLYSCRVVEAWGGGGWTRGGMACPTAWIYGVRIQFAHLLLS